MHINTIKIILLLGLVACAGYAVGQKPKPFKTSMQLQKELGALNAPVAKSIPWEADAYAAITKAVSEHRPVVVLFTNAPGPDAGELSEKTLRELEADGLKEFHDQVVFAHVQFSKTIDQRTDFGVGIAKYLKLTDVPTLVFLAPNPTTITDAYRMEGYFSVAEIKADMAKAIPVAMQSKFTWAQPSPAELVAQLSEAYTLGQPNKYACCFAEPLRSALGELVYWRAYAGVSKQEMLTAIDQVFGHQSDRLTFVDDDEAMIGELREVTGVDLIEAISRDGKVTVKLLVTRLARTGAIKKQEVTMRCIEEGHGWRLITDDIEDQTKKAKQHTDAVKSLPDDFNQIAQQVAQHKFASAAEARLAAEKIYLARKTEAVVQQAATSDSTVAPVSPK